VPEQAAAIGETERRSPRPVYSGVPLSHQTLWTTSRVASFSANTRAKASVSPPGGNDAIMVIGSNGHDPVKAGAPGRATSNRPNAIRAENSRRRRIVFGRSFAVERWVKVV
jgi:hypothetical protein